MHITTAYAASNTASLAGVTAGDLIVVFARRAASTTAPSLGTDYINIATQSNVTFTASLRVGYKVATGTETDTSTWANATQILASVYRYAGSTPVGASATGTSSGAWPGLSLTGDANRRWVVGASFEGPTAPDDVTVRRAGTELWWDTNGPVATWSGGTGSVEVLYGVVEISVVEISVVEGNPALFWAFP